MALALGGAGAATAEVRSTDVSSEGDRFRISVTSFIDAPPERVMGLLTDYPQLQRLHPVVVSSELVQGADVGSRVRTDYYDCPVFIICMEFSHTSTFRQVSDRHLVAMADPALSDFAYGRFEWNAVAEDGGTRLSFLAEVEPDFWLPPLVGEWVLKQRLLEVATELQQALQVLARGGDLPEEWPDGPARTGPGDVTE